MSCAAAAQPSHAGAPKAARLFTSDVSAKGRDWAAQANQCLGANPRAGSRVPRPCTTSLTAAARFCLSVAVTSPAALAAKKQHEPQNPFSRRRECTRGGREATDLSHGRRFCICTQGTPLLIESSYGPEP